MLRMNHAAALVAALMIVSFQATFAAEAEAVPGEFIVKFKDEVPIGDMKSSELSSIMGSYVKNILPEENIIVIKRPVFEKEASVLSSIEAIPEVEIVEPNYIYRISKTPNDPMLGLLWGISNKGQKDSRGQVGLAGIDVDAERAWDIQTGSKDVIVAVIDTGIDYNNPNLKDNVWTNEEELNGKPGVDDDRNGYVDDIHGYNFTNDTGDPMDDQGHGTHCSGTIGATGNDGSGIVGVAWNTRIMGVKFLDAGGSGTLENALKAINYATKNKARIMSNSWGGGGFSKTLKKAIQKSHKSGALFVAAAGNSSQNNDQEPTYPGSYDVPNVLAVAAINNQGKMASFSSYGKKTVHVAGPGVNVTSTTLDGKYDSWSGTSMATPHVSGVAVLLASQFPKMKNTQMKARLIKTVRPIAALESKVASGGLVNAYAALTDKTPEPIVDPNNPEIWQQKAVNVSSAHPYADKTEETFEVTVDGAQKISLFFEKFETESIYDTVTIYDSAGNLVQTLSGFNDGTYSSIITGSYAKVVFKSDHVMNKYGFDITKVAFK